MFGIADQIEAKYFILKRLHLPYLILRELGGPTDRSEVGVNDFPYIQNTEWRGVNDQRISRLE
jgi:hypothetical protein